LDDSGGEEKARFLKHCLIARPGRETAVPTGPLRLQSNHSATTSRVLVFRIQMRTGYDGIREEQMPEISFNLNGNEVTCRYREGMHFLELLREELGITSLKDGCAPEGFCGCCTILLDGRPALACLTKPASVEGRKVTTLEGLPEELRQRLARAFVEEGGVQCGFCTPGITMRAAHLIEHGLAERPERIRRALRSHFCRCTGYQRIVSSIQSAARGEAVSPRQFFGEAHGFSRDPDAAAACRPDGVGASTTRLHGIEQVLGKKAFVADLKVPDMLHAALVLSEHPRARLLELRLDEALQMEGVHRILTADDIPGERFIGLIERDWPLMVAAGEITRCVGDVLALVIAESQFEARMAAAAVEARYEILKPLTSPDEALAPGAPELHPKGNLLEVCAYHRGDVEEAFRSSDIVIEERFETQRIEHAFLEVEAALAIPGAEGCGIRIYSQGQGVHEDRRQIAAILGLPLEEVEVELVSNGGAFGGKEDLSVQGHAALAAHLMRRPVRLVLSREQSLRIHPKRHPLRMDYKVGADHEGHLKAVRVRIVGDTGAYASVGAKVIERAAGHACGPYRVPCVDVEGKTVYTNNVPCGAMRGFGVNQTAFAIEGMLDRIAEKVGIDGWEIRKRNILRPGDRFAPGQIMTESCGIEATLDAVRDLYRKAPRAGIACGIKNTGIGNGLADTGRVLIRVLEGEHIEALSGFTEMGQGLHTIIRQVICHETGLDPANIEVRTLSRSEVECGMTTASRATALSTMAAKRAAEALMTALDSRSLGELEGQEFLGEYICDFTVPPGTAGDNPRTHLTFGYATQVVILDEEGRIEKIVAAHDVGRAINPLFCAGQIEGGVHMGLGQALSEDFPCENGVPTRLKLRQIGFIPADRVPPIETILLEVPDEVGGYGSKGVGEIGLVPTAAAVASALYIRDGIRHTSLPMLVDDLLPDPRRRRKQG